MEALRRDRTSVSPRVAVLLDGVGEASNFMNAIGYGQFRHCPFLGWANTPRVRMSRRGIASTVSNNIRAFRNIVSE